MGRLARAFLTAAFVIGMGLPAAAQAQEAVPAPKVLGDPNGGVPFPWMVSCNSQPQTGNLVCLMSLQMVDGRSGQRIVSATIVRPKAEEPAVLRLSLPHGVLLQKGVDVWVDTSPAANYPITVADQNGSYADVKLDGNFIVVLQAGSVLHVAVTSASEERIEFQLSLKGFTAAFSRI